MEKTDWLRRFPTPEMGATKIGKLAMTKTAADLTMVPGAAPNTMTGQTPIINYGVGIGGGALLGLLLVGGPVGVLGGAALGAGAGFLASRPKQAPGTGTPGAPGAVTGWWVTPGVSYIDARGRAWTLDPLYNAEATAVAGQSRYKRVDGAFLIGPTINPSNYAADAAAWAIRFDTSP